MDNPYIAGRPIRDPKNFFGRKDEIKEIFSLIKKLQPISLIGQRKIGRTSLLHYISNPTILSDYLEIDNFSVLYINFEGLCEFSQTQFWKLILTKIKTIANNLIQPFIKELLTRNQISTPDIYSLIENFSNQNINVVFCFDEFESVTKNPNLNQSFFNNLRYLVSTYSNVTYITVSKSNLLDLTYSKEISSSPFFNIFLEKKIGFLNGEDTEKLIFEPSEQEGLLFNEEDREFIFDVAHYHPFFVQSACYNLFKSRLNKRKISGEKLGKSLYEEIKWTLYKELENHFEYYWKSLEDKEKKRLKKISKNKWNDNSDSIMIKLRNLSLLKEKNGEYELFSSIFKQYCDEIEFIENPFEAT